MKLENIYCVISIKMNCRKKLENPQLSEYKRMNVKSVFPFSADFVIDDILRSHPDPGQQI